jgi:hypothetical protein
MKTRAKVTIPLNIWTVLPFAGGFCENRRINNSDEGWLAAIRKIFMVFYEIQGRNPSQKEKTPRDSQRSFRKKPSS